jgi:hypothetical protein
MNTRLITSFILSAFVLLAVFGLYIPTAQHGGHERCPFNPVAAAECVLPLTHLGHWQSSVIGIVAELVVLVGAALILILGFVRTPKRDAHFERYRARERMPIRPTLLQELFSRGILNRKEPQLNFAKVTNH